MSASAVGMKECKEEVWKGFIPVKFALAPSDLTVRSIPDPVHILVSRFTYLSVVAGDIIEYFQRSAMDFSTDIWFDFDGIPLRSELPVGVLHDVYLGRRKFSSPWKINVHFQAYPRSVLVHRHSSTALEVQKLFFHSMKQALFLLNGNAQMFNGLSVEDQQAIWRSVETGHFVHHEGIFRMVSKLNREQVRLLPVRLVSLVPAVVAAAVGAVPSIPLAAQAVDTSAPSAPPSAPSSTKGGTGMPPQPLPSQSPTTLQPTDLVVTLSQRPVHCLTQPVATSAGVSADASGNFVVRPRTLREVLIEDFKQYDLNQLASADRTPHYSVQGLDLSLDLPIHEVWCLFAHADMFLYVTLHNR